jgi:hypothetical protein
MDHMYSPIRTTKVGSLDLEFRRRLPCHIVQHFLTWSLSFNLRENSVEVIRFLKVLVILFYGTSDLEYGKYKYHLVLSTFTPIEVKVEFSHVR